ncbi:MAG: tetratricopeptide repeat protein [Candidatus Sericytochromatia bacterium]
MERIKKDNQLDPVSKLHVIYGTIIMFMSVAFVVTLLTMQSTYKSKIQEAGISDVNQQSQMPSEHPNNGAESGSGMPTGGGGMPPFLKKMVEGYKSDLAKNPKDTKALLGLANMYYDSGQYPKAIDYYEKAVAIEPKNSSARADLGTCYFYSNMNDKAIKHFKIAIESDPANLNARYNLGIVYKNDGKVEQARKEWEAMKPYLKTEDEKKKLNSILDNLSKSNS